MPKTETKKFCPKSQAEWREWLVENHHSSQSVWLVYYRTSAKTPSLTWSEAVDEALCFGWIDSTKKTIDKERYMQYFSKRKPKSAWSKVNKDKVDELVKNKLMKKAGMDCILKAKENGAWVSMDDVENLIVPQALSDALNKMEGAMAFFESLSKSNKKILLHWVIVAKRQETKEKRITEIVIAAGEGEKPKQFI
ncbi:hypothetical protein DNU06_09100 [Putridiphycobacter roseus]|uniref:Bacteriocin-protection protein n=1 Tax=Putridiphycobacter roseus TaxID=2219161 RepID=A0A2W1MZR5_9FLAO|nr:YdeI/OmpD-associated family protein [Putridiphycobacter roseus]PZE17417.1 hypothetical protein DNU06_09100 [Putridiphycobacter roseus]